MSLLAGADFNCHWWFDYFRSNPGVPVSAGAIYVVLLVGIPYFLKDSEGYRLKHSFALWNAFVSAFSWFGTIVAVPWVYATLRTKGYHYLICSDEVMFGDHTPESGASCYGWMGVVMTLFPLSKIPEFIDTAFLLFRKKPVRFLHWYHHLSVMLCSWIAYATAVPSGMMFAAINYTIHAIMYAYFAATTYTKALSFMRRPITTLQNLQMFAGLGVTMSTAYYHMFGNCSNTYFTGYYYQWNCTMFITYIILFGKLYVDEYVKPKPKTTKKVQ